MKNSTNKTQASVNSNAANNSDKITCISSLSETMLYTYVDKDKYAPARKAVVFTPAGAYDTTENYMGPVQSGLHGKIGESTDERLKQAENRIYKEKPYKMMYICLATDVDIENLKKNPWDPSYFYTENVLCEIKLFQDGLIETSPGFSDLVPEHHLYNSEEVAAVPDIFIDDSTIASGLKRGFKLVTFRVKSRDGSEFEYAIQNMNGVTIPHMLKAIREDEREIDSMRAANSRGQLGDNWKQDPPSRDCNRTITFFGEIVSGQGFDGDCLFVNYQTVLPQGWYLRSGNLGDGVKEEDVSKQAVELDGFVDEDAARGVLRGSTHTAIAREAARGMARAPGRPRWRGSTVLPPFDEMTSAVIAYGFFFTTVASIILGTQYPFWLVPVFTFVFALGTGYPGGTTQAVLTDRTQKGSGLHLAGSNAKKVVGSTVSMPEATFNHLLNFSFDVKDTPGYVQDGGAAKSENLSEQPTLLFEVYSVGLFGRYSLEGYGYLGLPNKAGCHVAEVRTWRPVGGLQSKLADHFLGNSMRLRDEMFAEVPSRGSSALNKFGVQTETSGNLKVRVHTIVSGVTGLHKKETTDGGMGSTTTSEQLNNTQLRRTVDEILSGFKSLSLGSGRSSQGLNTTSSTWQANLTSGLNNSMLSTGAGDRISEILARARARKEGQSVGPAAQGLAPMRDQEESKPLLSSSQEMPSSSIRSLTSLLGESKFPDKQKNRYDEK